MAAAVPWTDIAPVVGSALTSASATYKAQQDARQARLDREEQARQFNISNSRQFQNSSRSQSLSEAEQANMLQRQMAMAPMRDRMTYNIMQRAGMPSRTFRPDDMYNPLAAGEQTSAGGIDQNELNTRQGAYTPGAGGQMNNSLQQAVLGRLGYSADKDGQYSNNTAQYSDQASANYAQDKARLLAAVPSNERKAAAMGVLIPGASGALIAYLNFKNQGQGYSVGTYTPVPNAPAAVTTPRTAQRRS